MTDRPAFSVQHHPEASPGPRDSHYLFARFVAMMEKARLPEPQPWGTWMRPPACARDPLRPR
jgi:hypothetical protein